MARPEKYKAEYAKQAEVACRLGATDSDLAELFSVARRTINYWRIHHKAFAEAAKVGKAPADDRVEASLYHRATGYSYDAVKIFNHQGVPVIVPYVEHVPPDTTACIFWLKNRRPDEWRNNPEDAPQGDDLAAALSKIIARLPN